MNRTALIGLLALVPLIGLAACGDDSDPAPATQPPGDETSPPGDDTLPPVDDGAAPPSDGDDTAGRFQHPTGADDVVVRIAYEGGFLTPELTFLDLPMVLVSGDGRVFQQGPVIAIYPGPMLPNIQERSITDDGIREILRMADDAGLLIEREYERPDMIADAPDTVVTINVDGETFEHRAYALGLAGGESDVETDAERAALQDFVVDVQTYVTGTETESLGPEASFDGETYLFRALLAGDWVDDGSGIEPTVVEWPADASVPLDGEVECGELAVDEFRTLFEDANQLTWFASDGQTYQLFVKPQLPGDSC